MRTETRRPVRSEIRPSRRERWQVDPANSTLTFTLRHIVVQQIEGRFHRWGGRVEIDRDQPSLSEVEVWVDLASIDTDSVERDDHVRSPEFFDVGRFPRATFKSTSIALSEQRIRVEGILDLHGTARPVEMEVTVARETREGDVARATVEASGSINRQIFGLHWNQDLDVGGVVVGDSVELLAHVALIQLPEGFGPAAR
jgi:polyisoprenoid-binding protein YceI